MNHVLRLVGATHRQHIILPIFSDYSLFQDDGRQQQLADALQLLNRGLDMLRYPKPIKSIGISSFHHYKLDDTVGTSFTIFFWLPASCPSSLHILIPSSFLDITLRRAMKITREFFCGQLEHFIGSYCSAHIIYLCVIRHLTLPRNTETGDIIQKGGKLHSEFYYQF